MEYVDGRGLALAADKWAIARAAREHQWHPADLGGIKVVESGSFGWFRNGQIKILPEPHVFRRRLPERLRAKAIRQGLATRGFRATKASGHYKSMRGPKPRYDLLNKMIQFCLKHNKGMVGPAYMSVSIGDFQIMGFHWKALGFKSAKNMFDQFCASQTVQINAFVKLLLQMGLKQAIRDRNFARVETVYNGGGLNGAYARRMKRESDILRRTVWKDWPNMQIPDAVEPTGKVKDPIEEQVKKVTKGVGGATGAASTGEAAVGATGFPWETVLGVGLGIAVVCVIAYFAYGAVRDRLDDRLPQSEDEVDDAESDEQIQQGVPA